MFRIVTGSQDQHSVIRAKIVQHMIDKAPLMLAHIVALPGFKECTSVQDYVQKTKMDLLGSWGTDIELLCFAHLTNTCVFTYIIVQSNVLYAIVRFHITHTRTVNGGKLAGDNE